MRTTQSAPSGLLKSIHSCFNPFFNSIICNGKIIAVQGGIYSFASPPPLDGDSPPPLPEQQPQGGPPPLPPEEPAGPPPLPPSSGQGQGAAPPDLPPPPRKSPFGTLKLILIILVIAAGVGGYYLLGFQYPPKVREAIKYYDAGNYMASYLALKSYMGEFKDQKAFEQLLSLTLDDLKEGKYSGQSISKKQSPHPEALFLMGKLRLEHGDMIEAEEKEGAPREYSFFSTSTSQCTLGRQEIRAAVKMDSSYRSRAAEVLSKAIQSRSVVDEEGIKNEVKEKCAPLLSSGKTQNIWITIRTVIQAQKDKMKEVNGLIDDLANYDSLLAANYTQKRPDPSQLDEIASELDLEYRWEETRVLAEQYSESNPRQAVRYLDSFIRRYPSSTHLEAAQEMKDRLQDSLQVAAIGDYEEKLQDLPPQEALIQWKRYLQTTRSDDVLQEAVRDKIESLEQSILKNTQGSIAYAKSPEEALQIWEDYLRTQPFPAGQTIANKEIEKIKTQIDQYIYDHAYRESQQLGSDLFARVRHWEQFLQDYPQLRMRDQAAAQLQQARDEAEQVVTQRLLEYLQQLPISIQGKDIATIEEQTTEAGRQIDSFFLSYPNSQSRNEVLAAAKEYHLKLIAMVENAYTNDQLSNARRICTAFLRYSSNADSMLQAKAHTLLNKIQAEEQKQLLAAIQAHIPGSDLSNRAHSQFLQNAEEFLRVYESSPAATEVQQKYWQIKSAVALAEDWKSVPIQDRFLQEKKMLREWPDRWPGGKTTIAGWIERDRPEYWKVCVFPEIEAEVRAMINPIDKTKKAERKLYQELRTNDEYGVAAKNDLEALQKSLPDILAEKWYLFIKDQWPKMNSNARVMMANEYLAQFPTSLYSKEIELLRNQETSVRRSAPKPGDLRF